MQERITVFVGQHGIAAELHQVLKAVPVECGTRSVHRSDAVLVFGVGIRITILQQSLNDVLVTSENGLVYWHLAATVDARAEVFEGTRQNLEVLNATRIQQIVQEVLLVQQDVHVVVVVCEENASRLLV